MYDIVVVGARCAGALTALLLARGGHRVLLVDRATVASETLCTHYLSPAGAAALAAHGLLQRLTATGCPVSDRTTVWLGRASIVLPGVSCAPRRFVLDALLAEAATAAGAEMRESFTVSDLVWEGDRVTGVVGHGGNGRSVVETALVVVGADGRRSLVADAVAAHPYRQRPAMSCCYYAYWSGLPVDAPELHLDDRRAVGVFPTHENLACVVATRPVLDWVAYKRAPEATYRAHLASFPGLTDRFATASRESRFFGSADLGGCFRRPWGLGWALVGDAGLHRDPLLGGGMADAFAQAGLLAHALRAGLEGEVPLDAALDAYHRRRDEALGPVYEAACALASFTWTVAELPHLLGDLVAATPSSADHPVAPSRSSMDGSGPS